MKVGNDLHNFISDTIKFAIVRQHEFLTPEHFIKMMISDKTYEDFFDSLNVDTDVVDDTIEEFFDDKLETSEEDDIVPIPTEAFNKCLDLAAQRCISRGSDTITVFDVFISIFNMKNTYASSALQLTGINEEEIEDAIDQITGVKNSAAPSEASEQRMSNATAKKDGKHGKSALAKYGTNLTQEAKDGKIMPIIGRDEELKETIRTLCRKTKSNPIYVGDAGVGKTAIAEALAQVIADGNITDALKDFEVWSVEMGTLVAGTQYRGEFEKRLKDIVDEVIDKKNIILFIDEIHTMIGAGSGKEGGLDAANIIKPALARGKMKCIGATTYDEYKKVFEKDKALARRFQKIEVLEPSRDDTVKIISGIAPKFEDFHKVKYDAVALEKAVDMSIQFLPERRLPDKAIDIIDEAGAMTMLAKGKTVTEDTVKTVISKMAKVPLESLNSEDENNLKSLESTLKNQIFGQDEAVERIVKSVKKARAGFKNPDKPEAAFLFVGPTGVGKTELCKVLSKELNEKLIRFDMSEYQEEYSVSKLIGSSAGYVGYEDGGLLTDAVRKDPHSIILFDEIEKAHKKVYNLMLQIMDYGTLTDNQGRKIDFKNCIIIMTSNVGVTIANQHKSLGFGADSVEEGNKHSIIFEEIEKTFAPEFRNRLDGVVMFNSLTEKVAEDIAKREVEKIAERLKIKGITLALEDGVISKISKEGYSKEFGGRNIAKTAETLIAEPLIDEVLFGKLKNGGKVRAKISKEEIKFVFSKA